MIRMEPASLGGLTAITGSIWVGGEITPLELSSFRLRLSEPLGEGSLLRGAALCSAASKGIVATANRPETIATMSVGRPDRDERVLRDRPVDMASLIDSLVALATQRGLREQLHDARTIERLRQMVAPFPYRVAMDQVRAVELHNRLEGCYALQRKDFVQSPRRIAKPDEGRR